MYTYQQNADLGQVSLLGQFAWMVVITFWLASAGSEQYWYALPSGKMEPTQLRLGSSHVMVPIPVPEPHRLPGLSRRRSPIASARSGAAVAWKAAFWTFHAVWPRTVGVLVKLAASQNENNRAAVRKWR